MNTTQKRLFSLLRSALWQTENDSEYLFVEMKEEEWERLFRLSASQGVHLLAYDGLRFLPQTVKVPFVLELRWAANELTSKRRFDHYLQTIEELARLLRNEGVDLLLFKGYTMSALYPIPHYREGGDIDLFLFDGGPVLDKIARNNQWEIDLSHPPHSRIIYQHELIENHHSFFDGNYSTKSLPFAWWEAELWKLIKKEKCLSFNVGKEHVLKMPLEAEALYMAMHNAKHLASPDIALRQLCDYVQFIRVNGEKMDALHYQSELKRLRLDHYSDLVASMCYEYLGLKDVRYKPMNRNPRAEAELIKHILVEKRTIPREGFRLKILIRHLKQLFGKKYLYSYFNHRNAYFGLILPTISRMIQNRAHDYFLHKEQMKG